MDSIKLRGASSGPVLDGGNVGDVVTRNDDGSVSFAPLPGGDDAKNTAPVRAVQTDVLAGWSYDPVLQILLAPTPGALASPWVPFDSLSNQRGAFDLIGARSYLVRQGTTADTESVQAGVYELTDGTSLNRARLQRRPDLLVPSDYADGVSVDVQDGQTLTGTRWQMENLGPVVPGHTALAFREMRPTNPLEGDITLPRYGLQVALTPETTATVPEGCSIINQALYDAELAGQTTIEAPMGYVNPHPFDPTGLEPPIPIIRRPGVRFVGPGFSQGGVAPYRSTGGVLCLFAANITPIVVGPTPVDSRSATPLLLRDPTYSDPVFQLTYAGCEFNLWAKYTRRSCIAPITLNDGLVWSTRGSVIAPSTDHPTTVMDECFTHADGSVIAALCLWSPDEFDGPAGAAVIAVTSGAIPPDIWLSLRCGAVAGARGTFTLEVSINGGLTYSKPVVSGATVDLGAIYRLLGTCVIAISNVAATTGQVWNNWQTRSAVTSAGAYQAGANQQFMTQWDGAGDNKLHLLVTTMNGSSVYGNRANVASAAFTFAHGRVNQRIVENSIVGPGVNTRLLWNHKDLDVCDCYFGSHSAYNAAPNVTGLICPTTMPEDYTDANQIGIYWVPGAVRNGVSNAKRGPDGKIYGWACYVGDGHTFRGGGLVVVLRVGDTTTGFASESRIEEYTIGSDAAPHLCAMLEYGPLVATGITNVRCLGQVGYFALGVAYYGDIKGLRTRTSRIGIANSGPGELPLDGFTYAEGAGVLVASSSNGFTATGRLWLNLQGRPFLPLALSDCTALIEEVIADDEGSEGCICACATAEASAGGEINVSGSFSASLTQVTPVIVRAFVSGAAKGVVRWNAAVAAPSSVAEQFSVPDTDTLPQFEGASAAYQVTDSGAKPPLTMRSGAIIPYGGAANSVVLGDASVTLTATNVSNPFVLPAGTLTIPRTLRLAGVQQGYAFPFAIGAQASALVIVDDASGATIDTIVAGVRGNFIYRANGPAFALAAA